MSLSASRVVLADAAKTLQQKWKATEEVWGDDQARQFDAEFISSIEPKVRQAVEAIMEFEVEFAAARRACE